jgi:hypothetical protein
MEISGDKESTWISSDISPLFFHIDSKLVQALVIIFNEISQALAIEGDILLLKPFLDPIPPTVQPQLSPPNTQYRPRNGFRTLAWTVSSDRNRWPRRCLFSLKNR